MATIYLINQYAATPDTGAHTRHHHLGSELVKQGHSVYLIHASWHHLLRPDIPQDLPTMERAKDGYHIYRVPVPKYAHAHDKKRILNWFFFGWKLRRLEKKLPQRPDVIVYSSPSLIPFSGAARLAKRTGARLAFEVRDIWPLTLCEVGGLHQSNPLIRFMQYIEHRAYRISDVVISNLPNAVEHMRDHGLDPKKFHWIPNGYSARDQLNQPPLNASSAAALPKAKFLIGYTGTIGEANELDTFVLAAEILKEQTDIAFVIVGSGKNKAQIATLIDRRGLSNVHLVDPIPKPEVPAMLALFDACYIGLRPDPQFRFGVSPNKLFDYLVSGKPIVYAIDSGSYRPVEEGCCGVQVVPGDPVALAQAIKEMRDLPEQKRADMGASGMLMASEKYEYKMLAQMLEAALLDTEI